MMSTGNLSPANDCKLGDLSPANDFSPASPIVLLRGRVGEGLIDGGGVSRSAAL